MITNSKRDELLSKITSITCSHSMQMPYAIQGPAMNELKSSIEGYTRMMVQNTAH